MTCEICHKAKPSTVIFKDGKELYVCKKCAADIENKNVAQSLNHIKIPGLPPGVEGHMISIDASDPPPELKNLLDATLKIVGSIAEKKFSRKPKKTCPACKRKWKDILDEEVISCVKCFDVFADEIIKRYGDTQYGKKHIGEPPSNYNPNTDKIKSLKTKLKKAIASENFELAAKIRKCIDTIEKGG
jgi:protein-arginine kinase activator protein McsA